MDRNTFSLRLGVFILMLWLPFVYGDYASLIQEYTYVFVTGMVVLFLGMTSGILLVRRKVISGILLVFSTSTLYFLYFFLEIGRILEMGSVREYLSGLQRDYISDFARLELLFIRSLLSEEVSWSLKIKVFYESIFLPITQVFLFLFSLAYIAKSKLIFKS